ncbi:ABC transporter substrate-binding protein [Flavobacterium channae]|uniref:ABC transporter substrate-binding protein n=1 Tax=Flavobacterium channae TaxID=2897181 RepID=UPI001E4AB2B3|nr:ABC transporter substrate-binding protein [Flavobacterium channae]UGS24521.1 ABC transporter substrate-binding protein [Flavobacterium channae]
MRHYFFLVILFLGFIQCKESENTDYLKNSANNSIIYAEGFSIQKYDGFSVMKVSNAYPESKENYTYVLRKKGAQIPDSLQQFTAIEIPIKKIIVTSTTHIPALESLGVEKTLIGFPTTNYISSEKTRTLIDAGKIRDLGSNQGLNTEVILDIQPDVIVGFSVDGDLKTYKNLEKNGQKIIFNGDWTEKTPLGKAEWIKFFGALYNLDEKANEIFNSIEKEYKLAATLAKNAKTQPSIFAGAIYEDQWFLPQGDSWAAYFLKEANGNYLWKDSKGTGSLSLSFESVLDKASDADFWIGPGQFTSIQEILDNNPNYIHFKAVKNKNVYSFSTKKGKTGGVIYYELAQNRPDLVLKDIVKILHPEVLPDYELYFFEKLK